MTSPADHDARGELLKRLRERLEQAVALTDSMRGGLEKADVAAIEAATGRLETLVLEYRLLADEYRRACGNGEGLAELEALATRIARSSAISAGFLDRMIATNRALRETLVPGDGAGYGADGQAETRLHRRGPLGETA